MNIYIDIFRKLKMSWISYSFRRYITVPILTFCALLFIVIFNSWGYFFECPGNSDQQSKTANLLNPNAIFISLWLLPGMTRVRRLERWDKLPMIRARESGWRWAEIRVTTKGLRAQKKAKLSNGFKDFGPRLLFFFYFFLFILLNSAEVSLW